MTRSASEIRPGEWAIRLPNAPPASIARLFRIDRWITGWLQHASTGRCPTEPGSAKIRSGPARGIEVHPGSERLLWNDMRQAKRQEVTARFPQSGNCSWEDAALDALPPSMIDWAEAARRLPGCRFERLDDRHDLRRPES